MVRAINQRAKSWGYANDTSTTQNLGKNALTYWGKILHKVGSFAWRGCPKEKANGKGRSSWVMVRRRMQG